MCSSKVIRFNLPSLHCLNQARIAVAWLAKMNPYGMLIVAVFIAMLERGSNTIQTQFKIPASAADVLIGIILFFMLGCEFFINYRLIVRGKEEKNA